MKLIQHPYSDDPWRVMICCILLNRTGGRQVRSILDEFFRRWPHEFNAHMADPGEIEQVIRPLGLGNRRAKTIVKFSTEYIYNKWSDPRSLHGIGQYAWEAWQIVCNGRTDIKSTDKVLQKFLDYANAT